MPDSFSRTIRWTVDAVGGAAAAAGLQIELTPQAILAAARRKTGLQDLGALEYPDGLRRFCRALSEEAMLSPAGRLLARRTLRQVVANRLLLTEARRSQPEIFQAELRPFVLICGLPRSGVTPLHHALSASGAAWGPPAWEAAEPPAAPPRRPRAALDESLSLLDPSFWSPNFWRAGSIYSYQRWWLAQDPEPAYRVYRDLLLWLQALHPGRMLVRKAPCHVGFMDTIARVMPQVRLVQLHRDPVEAITGYCDLLCATHGLMSRRVDPEALGDPSLALWGQLIDRSLRARAGDPGLPVVDVAHRALVADPIGTALSVAAAVGLPASDDAEAHYRAALAPAWSRRRERPVSSPQDYDLTERQIRWRFADYLESHPQASASPPPTH